MDNVVCFKKDGKLRCYVIPEFPFYYDFEIKDLSRPSQFDCDVEDVESDSQEQVVILAKNSQTLVESIDDSCDEH